MNTMNNNKSKQNNDADTENSSTKSSMIQNNYLNSFPGKIQLDLSSEEEDKFKHSTPTCHAILQKRSLPARPHQLLQADTSRSKQAPPPPPLNIKNRFGSTTELQANYFRSEAEEIARELQIVNKIQNISSQRLRHTNLRNGENQHFGYDYNENNDLNNEVIDYLNVPKESHEQFLEPHGEPIYNIGEKFKIARPVLSRTTSVGRLVNNFESLEETRSLAGDVKRRSPPITNSQRRFGSLIRQRTHLGLGCEYGAMTSDENDHYNSTNNMMVNGNREYPDIDDGGVGWGATRQNIGVGFRGPTNIWSAKFFVPPTQPKPPLPPPPACLSSKSTNHFQHSVCSLFFM